MKLKLFTVLLCFLALSSTSLAKNEVKSRLSLGVILPLSGSLGASGREILRGIEIAQDHLRKSSANLVNRIEVYPEDTKSLASESEKIAKRLISARKADVIIGALTNSTTFLLARTIAKAKRPMVIPSASQSGITLLNKGVFRTCASADDQAYAMARFAIGTLKKKKIAIITEKGITAGSKMAMIFEKQLKQNGARIIYKHAFENLKTESDQIIKNLRQKGIQTVYAPLFYDQAAQLILEANRQGFKGIFLGSDSWHSGKLIQSLKQLESGEHYFTTAFSTFDTNQNVQNFIKDYQKKYSSQPTSYAAQGFDAYQFVASSFAKSKSTLPKSLIKAFSITHTVEGIGGPFQMTKKREPAKSWVILKIDADGLKFKTRLRGKVPDDINNK
jgi:branched-chain amino acid transport system substrate-binding protein